MPIELGDWCGECGTEVMPNQPDTHRDGCSQQAATDGGQEHGYILVKTTASEGIVPVEIIEGSREEARLVAAKEEAVWVLGSAPIHGENND